MGAIRREVLLSWGADPNFGDTARGIPSALALTRRGGDLFRFDCRDDVGIHCQQVVSVK